VTEVEWRLKTQLLER